MANSPGTTTDHDLNFRAPPPSPIASHSARRSSVVNDEELSEFLQTSLRIPDLILPGRIFPRETLAATPPEIDLQSLTISSKTDSISKIRESITSIGCFQLVNHGIPRDLIRSVSVAGAGIFELPAKSKAMVARSTESRCGFEEFYGEEETETSEEFIWGGEDDGLKSVMERIWSEGYSNFSQKMNGLAKEVEEIAEKVLVLLSDNVPKLNKVTSLAETKADRHELVCCLYRHCQNIPVSQRANYLKSDIIRMLIRGSDYSHALCFHICDGLSEFHLYSKKDWITFCPNKDAIVVTTGDQLQAWSGGQYRNVIGRPIFKVEDQDPLSMSFLYSPSLIRHSCKGNKEKTISLRQQVILALLLTLIYHTLVSFYVKL
ncbi:hypothetical protein Scep_008090 [Stephania cephalantha]|uniref:1-aminocyclopropane-1-carboxylate oxidase n=1 Tax=Stephania cephalantha TaxID=152367 RepID=A0AAP0PLR0_9MAGN